MDVTTALEWAATKRNAVLITLRRDGRAQSSDIAFGVVDDVIKISVTDDRAKTRNIIRDPRVVFHITDPGSWSYVSIDAVASLSDVATAPDDAAADELVGLYQVIAGEHDDWDEYRRAMVSDRRRVVRLDPQSVTGQIH